MSREKYDLLLSNPDSPLPPFRWEPNRRFVARCELDAAFFHLYGIGRDDADYIMETFPIVKRKDEAAHGEYRTKRVILEIYDQMARAAETGQPYQTPLDPPPVDLLGTSRPATVTPLRPRSERPVPAQPPETRPEELPAFDRAAEARHEYAPTEPSVRRAAEPEQQANSATEPAPTEEIRLPTGAPRSKAVSEPEDGAPAERAAPEAPNLYEGALALHACVPDGEKVEQDGLLADAARELGHPKLTNKVRRALNKALNAENNAGRLKTDWERVWKPRKQR